MLSPDAIESAAMALHEAECSGQQIAALTRSYPAMDMNDAYAVQRRWVEHKLSLGQRIVGYKIGLTSRAMQMAMNIDTPDYGVLLDDMVIANGSAVRAAQYTDPRLEVEFAFVLKEPLAGSNVTIEQVLQATEYIAPAFELIAARSYRIDPETGYTRTVFDTIADNAANAGVVLGDRRIAPGAVDLRWAGAMLYLNGAIEETGLGAGVMDHPAHGVRWVCKRFAAHGVGLEPGQVILSGSFTRPVKVSAGDSVKADFGDLGSVALEFT